MLVTYCPQAWLENLSCIDNPSQFLIHIPKHLKSKQLQLGKELEISNSFNYVIKETNFSN